jgi:hypothetical protein
MIRTARELVRLAEDILRRTSIVVPRKEGIKPVVYNEIHSEVNRFLDRVRRNEGLSTSLARVDTDFGMLLEVGFTDHEAKEAISREVEQLVARKAKKFGIEEVRTQ